MNDVRFRAPGSPPVLRLQPGDISLIGLTFAVVAVFTIMRIVFAVSVDLRVDEAYYWTWSRENVVSYLDHPPAIAWLVRASTAVFGDTNFGVRFPGLLGMAAMQVLLADIVWRIAKDVRCACIAVLLAEATIDYGLFMTRIGPDTALIPFSLAMAWALVRLTQSGDQRWWLAAGAFGGLALLSKYTAVLLVPAIAAFVLVPSWRMIYLRRPYLWLGGLIALAMFAPVILWNAGHDWVSFRFQMDRPAQVAGWSAKFMLEFLGQQLGLVGPLIFPLILIAAAMLARRGYREKEPLAILFSTAVIFPVAFFLWRSLYGRIGDGWPLAVWPFGFVCIALNLHRVRRDRPGAWLTRMAPALVSGLLLVFVVAFYYLAGGANYLKGNDPVGKEAGFAEIVEKADVARKSIGASWFATTDYRIYALLRWHLRDRVPVIQINERNRFVDFRAFTNANLGGDALYIAPVNNPFASLLGLTPARLKPLADIDLIWRGVRYDSYRLQTMSGWTPNLSPPPGDPFYVGAPH